MTANIREKICRTIYLYPLRNICEIFDSDFQKEFVWGHVDIFYDRVENLKSQINPQIGSQILSRVRKYEFKN